MPRSPEDSFVKKTPLPSEAEQQAREAPRQKRELFEAIAKETPDTQMVLLQRIFNDSIQDGFEAAQFLGIQDHDLRPIIFQSDFLLKHKTLLQRVLDAAAKDKRFSQNLINTAGIVGMQRIMANPQELGEDARNAWIISQNNLHDPGIEKRIKEYYTPFRAHRFENTLERDEGKKRTRGLKTFEPDKKETSGESLANEYFSEIAQAMEEPIYTGPLRREIWKWIQEQRPTVKEGILYELYDDFLPKFYPTKEDYVKALRKGDEIDKNTLQRCLVVKGISKEDIALLYENTVPAKKAVEILQKVGLELDKLKLKRLHAKPLSLHLDILRDRADRQLQRDIIDVLATQGYDRNRISIEKGDDGRLHVYQLPIEAEPRSPEKEKKPFVFHPETADKAEIQLPDITDISLKDGYVFGRLPQEDFWNHPTPSATGKTPNKTHIEKDVLVGVVNKRPVIQQVDGSLAYADNGEIAVPADKSENGRASITGKVFNAQGRIIVLKFDVRDQCNHLYEEGTEIASDIKFKSIENVVEINGAVAFNARLKGRNGRWSIFLDGKEIFDDFGQIHNLIAHQNKLVFSGAMSRNATDNEIYEFDPQKPDDITVIRKDRYVRPVRKLISASDEIWELVEGNGISILYDVKSKRVVAIMPHIADVDISNGCVNIAAYLTEEDQKNHKLTFLSQPFEEKKPENTDQKEEIKVNDLALTHLIETLEGVRGLQPDGFALKRADDFKNFLEQGRVGDRSRAREIYSHGVARNIGIALSMDTASAFAATVAAMPDPKDPATVERIAKILFPLPEEPKKKKERSRSLEVPQTHPCRSTYYQNVRDQQPRDGDPREKYSEEILTFREPWEGNVFINNVYSGYDATSKTWTSANLPTVPETGIETRLRTFTIPRARELSGEIRLPLPLGVRLIEDRVTATSESGFFRKTKQPVRLAVRIDAFGQAFVALPQKHPYTEINYSAESPEDLPSLQPVSEKAFAAFTDRLSRDGFDDLLRKPAKLPPECTRFLSTIRTLPPHERAQKIESFVRESMYYDDGIAKHPMPQAATLDEEIQQIQARLERIRREHPEKTESLKGKRFAGICGHANTLTFIMLRYAGIPSGKISALAPSRGATRTTIGDGHAMAFALWPSETGTGMKLVPVDGTPSGTARATQQIVSAFRLESLEERSSKQQEQDDRVAHVADTELKRVEQLLLSRNIEDLRALENGKLETMLNDVLRHSIRSSHVDALHGLLNTARYAPLKFIELDFEQPGQRQAYLEFLQSEIEKARQFPNDGTKNRREAGTRLFRLFQDFERRYASDPDIRHRRNALTVLRYLLRLTSAMNPPLLDPIEQRAAELIVNYLNAKKVG